MKKETLEKANDIQRKIESLEVINKLLVPEKASKNETPVFGIGRGEYSIHYFNVPEELTQQLAEVVKKHIATTLPALQKELDEL